MQKQTLLGIDTGGTFTDFVLLDLKRAIWRVHKVLSTPKAPQEAILRGITELDLMDAVRNGEVTIVHGTTVATNAALEGKGARTAYITNTGLKDVLQIGRQTRAELYSLTPTKPAVPVDPELLFEIAARVDASGQIIEQPNQKQLNELVADVKAKQPEAIAINLLFSYLNPAQEIEIENLFTNEYFVSRSSQILPEYKEYERGTTTWVNSWLGPRIARYMQALQLELAPAPIAIMQSSGLTIAAGLAARRAVNLLLSGPAGGLSAARYIGNKVKRDRLLTFDMGGTSTDVALIHGELTLTNTGSIAGIPIGVPMADIHTIGAGGGSIASVDAGGLLQVGPESAGADPGPACYGKGGRRPTVTDANLVLGNLGENSQLADGLELDLEAANRALETVAKALKQSVQETAAGIIAVANEHMIQALRVISIQKGHDPRQFSLICFGGAGGLHVCDVADAMGIREIIVPIHGGVLSALGMLTTQPGRELVQTVQTGMNEVNPAEIARILQDLRNRGSAELAEEGITSVLEVTSLDLRYEGQTAALNIKFTGDLENARAAFEMTHEQQYGHRLDRPVELLNCRVHLEANQLQPDLPYLEAGNRTFVEGDRCHRDSLQINVNYSGPLLILDNHSTIRVTSPWQCRLDELGNLFLSR